MKTIIFSEQERNQMLTRISSQILYPQIIGPLNEEHLATIEEIVDDMLGRVKSRNDVDENEKGEIIYALVMEGVYTFDEQTVKDILTSAQFTETIDFDKTRAPKDNIIEAIGIIVKQIRSFFPEQQDMQNPFIIASPLMISIMQSAKGTRFAPAVEGSFKGPMNTMMVGKVEGIDVYSYLFPHDWGSEVLAGYRDMNDVLMYKKFFITNITFD